MFPGASRVLRDGRHSVYFSRLVSGPPLSSRYPAILVAAIALLAPTWVRNFSAFISSRRLSLSKAAAFGMLSDRPMHKGAVARHLIVFDRLGSAATRPVSIVTLSPNPRPFLPLGDDAIYRLAGLGLRPLPYHFRTLVQDARYGPAT